MVGRPNNADHRNFLFDRLQDEQVITFRGTEHKLRLETVQQFCQQSRARAVPRDRFQPISESRFGHLVFVAALDSTVGEIKQYNSTSKLATLIVTVQQAG